MITRYLAAELSQHFHFSSAKAERLLGYVPQVTWQEGLRKAVEAYTESRSEDREAARGEVR